MQKKYRRLMYIVVLFAIIFGMHSFADATETEPPTEHTHDWSVEVSRNDYHQYICNVCHETRQEAHTCDSDGNCTVCGHHVHVWHCVWSDDQMHNIVCSGCGEEKTTTHSKNSEGVCTVCGHTPHEHIWQYSGENYDYSHDLRCTQCAAVRSENHIYGNDGKCTVCGRTPPHEHQWEWDGNKSNYLGIHFLVCSCGATTAEDHRLFAWDGKTGNDHGHRMVCGVCGFDALIFDHTFDSAYFNGERCTVCGYPGQGTTKPETKPIETTPKETIPAETKPKENIPVVTTPVETTPVETTPVETAPVETAPVETESTETQTEDTESAENESTDMIPTSSETMPQNAAKEDSQRTSSVWVWVAAVLVVAGGLGTVVFFLKKKSS